MKQSVLTVLILVFTVSLLFSQNLDSGKFHEHRNSLRSTFQKFGNEKTGRIAFLGGSITYNPGWRDSVCTFLQKQFPATKFDFINAGVPSMGSTPGAFRFENDVLKNGKIDFLFLEAAVNDETNKTDSVAIIRGMEGIVRHALNENPDCKIIMMYFVDPGKMESYKAGKTPLVIGLHDRVARHYNISSINLAREVTERIDNGEFSWEKDFRDLHPSPFGQNIYYSSISQFLEKELNAGNVEMQSTKTDIPGPIDRYSYSKGVLIEPNPPKPIKGWEFVEKWKPSNGVATRFNYVDVPMLVGTYPGKIIKFQFKGNAVGISVAAGPDAGIIEYSIDDSQWKKQDLYTSWSKNLYLPWFYTLGSGLKNGKHMLQIRISADKNPESTGNTAVLRYFYVNGSE